MRCHAFLLVLALISTSSAEDWPQWRGEHHNSSTTEHSGWTGSEWPLVEAWRIKVGTGGTSPIVADGQLFSMGNDGSSDTVYCIDATTGKVKWKQTYRCAAYGRHSTGDKSLYRGPSSTPSYDKATGLLYTLSTDGDLRCWNTNAEGKSVWRMNLYHSYGTKQRPQVTKRSGSLRDYGYTSSPMIHGDWILIEVGDDEGNVMAFDKRTGRRIWTSQNNDPAGHTGGMTPMTVQGMPCVAVFTAYHLLVMRLDKGHEGKTVAAYPWRTDFINSIAAPTVHHDHVIVTSKYNQMRTAKLRVSLGGATKVWESESASGVCSPVVLNNHVYFANRGFWCLDLASGKRELDGDRFGDAGSCIVTSDGRIIVWASDGDLVLVESADRSPKTYRILAEKRRILRNTAWPHAALADGRLFCKDRDGHIVCFAISKAARTLAMKLEAATTPAPPQPNPSTPPVGVTSLPQVDVEHWPISQTDLLFAWKRGLGNRRAMGTAYKAATRFSWQARGDATLDNRGSMKMLNGSFGHDAIATALLAGCMKTNELTIEAVLTPANVKQIGPARAITFSESAYARNFTLGQDGDQLVLRLRTTRTDKNGMRPEVKLGQIKVGKAHHVILTYSEGDLACYLNGRRTVKSNAISGTFENWTAQHFLIGDEHDGGRTWAGTVDAIALYSRALTEKEAVASFARLGGKTSRSRR